jgi:hypothetical protein
MRRVRSLLFLALAACTTSEPAAPQIGVSSDVTVVTVLGDGFVRVSERRIPLELFVLEMRQRVRTLDAAAMVQVEVQIAVDPDSGETGARGASALVDQLYIMGVKQVRVR